MAKYGINKAILIGNLGNDPELRYTDGGIAVANLRLATTESFRSAQGGNIDKTEWHNIVLWRSLAETAGKYLKKGQTIYIEGRIVNKSWEKDGTKYQRTDIEADKLRMLGGGKPATSVDQGHGHENPVNESQNITNKEEKDDLPF